MSFIFSGTISYDGLYTLGLGDLSLFWTCWLMIACRLLDFVCCLICFVFCFDLLNSFEDLLFLLYWLTLICYLLFVWFWIVIVLVLWFWWFCFYRLLGFDGWLFSCFVFVVLIYCAVVILFWLMFIFLFNVVLWFVFTDICLFSLILWICLITDFVDMMLHACVWFCWLCFLVCLLLGFVDFVVFVCFTYLIWLVMSFGGLLEL